MTTYQYKQALKDAQGTTARKDLSQFPGTYGLPLLGHTLRLIKNPRQMEKEFYEKYGEAYQAGIAFRNTLTLHGPDAAELLFMDKDKVFSTGLGQPELCRVFPGFLLLRDFDEHKFHRKLLQPLFKKENMEDYILQMNQYVMSYEGGWGENVKKEFYPQAKEMALGIAASVFMGIREPERVAPFKKAFTSLADSLMALVRFPFPGNLVWKGERGRKYLHQEVEKHLADNKREGEGDAKDMLSHMADIRDEDGKPIELEEIMGHLCGFMFAAHDTTTSTICAAFYVLGKDHYWQDKLRAEILCMDKEMLELKDFDLMPEMDKVFKETLRLYPPAPSTFRRSIKEVEFNGITIPENTCIKISMDFIHQMPELWTEPEKFDPERFAPPREEHKKHQYAWVPFGGGAHKCIGMHFSNYEVKVVLFHLLKNYRIELDADYTTEFEFLPIPKPKDNLPITLVRITDKA